MRITYLFDRPLPANETDSEPFTNGELEQPADSVEVGMDSGDFRERLRIDRALELDTGQTASEDFAARAARLPGSLAASSFGHPRGQLAGTRVAPLEGPPSQRLRPLR